jgi:nucleotide-binding universal stress UspA family protein
VILEKCRDIQADLLVKGAYTHSRLRQVIFGGATEHVMKHAAVPVLLAH